MADLFPPHTRAVPGILLLGALGALAACTPSHPQASSAGPPYMPKGDLPVRVTDPEGRPIPGAAVSGSVVLGKAIYGAISALLPPGP